MDAAHLVNRQRHDVVHVAAHDPLEPVADPQHLDALQLAADRGGADDAVDAWGGSAADEDGELLGLTHEEDLTMTAGESPSRACHSPDPLFLPRTGIHSANQVRQSDTEQAGTARAARSATLVWI